MANISKHLSKLKIKKVKGIEVKTKGKTSISIEFPNIKFPQYRDEDSQSFVKIENDLEFSQAIDRGEKLTYGGRLLIKKDSKEGKEIKETFDKLWKYYKLEKVAKPRFGKYPLEDGEEKADELEAEDKNGDKYRGHWILKISSKYDAKKKKRRFKSFDKYNKHNSCYIPDSDDDINGFFVRVGLNLDFYDYGANIGLVAYMNAIQFLDQNPNLEFGTNYADEFEFEEQSEEEKEDNLSKALGSDDDGLDEMSLVDDESDESDESDEIDEEIKDKTKTKAKVNPFVN